jgi:hypothetical protein
MMKKEMIQQEVMAQQQEVMMPQLLINFLLNDLKKIILI